MSSVEILRLKFTSVVSGGCQVYAKSWRMNSLALAVGLAFAFASRFLLPKRGRRVEWRDGHGRDMKPLYNL